MCIVSRPVSPSSLAGIVLVASLLGCAARQSPLPSTEVAGRLGGQKRALDPSPRRTVLKAGLPAGRAEASFELDTGGDQGSSTKEAGLEVVVRFAHVELRQTIASCSEPSLGGALGGGSNGVLEVARCGSEFWLTTGDGMVVVKRQGEHGDGAEIARVALPKGIERADRLEGSSL
jgi:hypothetical protein